MIARVAGALRGAVFGIAAGLVWAAVEAGFVWASGSVVPRELAMRLAGLDLLVPGVVGLACGALVPGARRRTLALAFVGVYGLVRVFAPPGIGAEAAYLVVFAVIAAALARVTNAEVGWIGFLQLVALGTVGGLVGEAWVGEHFAAILRGRWLPFAVAAFASLPVAADAVLGVAIRRPGFRAAAELATGLVTLLVTAHPLSTAPLVEDLVTAVPPRVGTPDVILVSLDTTRADHLSTYGYARETSPQLSAFASDALLFTQARSPAGWTLPGHASMLTGLYPSRHGAQLAGTWQEGESIDGRRNVAFPLAPDRTTLAEALRDHGYETAGFVANFSYLYRDYGIAQGFGYYEDAPGLLLRTQPPVVRLVRAFAPGFCLKPYRHAHDVNAAALEWLDRAPRNRPVFLFLNYMEPHQPWMADAPYDRWAREQPQAWALAQRDLYTHEVRRFTPAELGFIVASYDGQLAAMDAALGELVAALKTRGRYENALVVVTADHGELLGEHGAVGHMGRMLYEPLVHVPLVVKFPGPARLRGRDETPVQLVDIVPTVLETAGAPPLAGVQGESLPRVTHAIVAEEGINPFLVASYGATYNRAVRVLYDGTYKLITTSRGDRMLFDLGRDPAETQDLAAGDPARVAELARRMEMVFDTSVAAVATDKQVN